MTRPLGGASCHRRDDLAFGRLRHEVKG